MDVASLLATGSPFVSGAPPDRMFSPPRVPPAPCELELGNPLGEGGGGVVHAARYRGQPVAVKLLHADLALSERERARFFDEAERMRRVAHPALVPVIDVGVLPDGRPFLVMPLLVGETLAAAIARGPFTTAAGSPLAPWPAPLPLDRALAAFAELAAAVDALHAAGLVHRDLKPENVMVVGEQRRLVLLDFGIARDVEAPPSTTTRAGGIRGTPAYMAAERLFGAPASFATDVYELAVTAYVMLAGHLPWGDAHDVETRMMPPPLDAPHVPSAVGDVIAQALSTRPEARPPSAGALAAALIAASHGVVLPAHAPPRGSSPSLAFRPTELPALGPPTGPFAAPPGAYRAPFPSHSQPGFAAPPTLATGAARRSGVGWLIGAIGALVLLVAAVALVAVIAAHRGDEPTQAAATTTTTSNAPPPRSPHVAAPVHAPPQPGFPETPMKGAVCHTLRELYCSEAWEKTEGAQAGVLCRQWERKTNLPDSACQGAYTAGLLVLRERQRAIANGSAHP